MALARGPVATRRTSHYHRQSPAPHHPLFHGDWWLSLSFATDDNRHLFNVWRDHNFNSLHTDDVGVFYSFGQRSRGFFLVGWCVDLYVVQNGYAFSRTVISNGFNPPEIDCQSQPEAFSTSQISNKRCHGSDAGSVMPTKETEGNDLATFVTRFL